MANNSSGFFPTSITKKQAKDAGMAVTLILLIIGFFTGNDIFYKIAIPVLIIDMIVPMFYYPFAIIWFGLSTLLGTVVSKILLSVVFFVLVLPIGLLRRLLGKDSLKLKDFKKTKKSVMKTRNQFFSPADLEKPF